MGFDDPRNVIAIVIIGLAVWKVADVVAFVINLRPFP